MKFMIFTQPDDTHAVITQLALESLGHHVRLLFGADQPALLSHSIWMDERQATWKSSDLKREMKLNEYDVVWYRRAHKPVLSKDATHPQDYAFVARENHLFFDGLTSWLSHQAWWINPPAGAKRANSKIVQLWIARQCGLSIPQTLCSNDPVDIYAFLERFQPFGVIYKPLCSHFWVEPKSVKASYTAQVTLSQLPSDDVLRLTPGLFQEQIDKCYELRVTCFGKHCVAVKLESQKHAAGEMDWRAIPDGELRVWPYRLPAKIEFKLQMLMRKLGIVFGCIDMIVTPEGEYVFLEVNEQGQFLWIDEYCPEAQLLDRFIQFILSRSFEFEWHGALSRQGIEHYREATEQRVKENLKQHIDVSLGEVA